MRFMMLMIPKVYQSARPSPVPGAKAVEAMTRYNNELQKAGVLLAVEGLHPTSEGARVKFAQGKSSLKRGPFATRKDVLGGFWIIKVNSLDDAIGWAKRCPAEKGDIIEIRRIQEISEFPADVQKAAAGFEARPA